jgi:hypothetical protein
MRYLLSLAVAVVLGCLAWLVGSRLSTDAVGMGIGLIFGVMAGVPAALLVLATTGGRRGDDGDGGYEAGRRQGFRDAIDLAQGRRPELPMETMHTVEYGSNGVRVEKTISIARPFGHLVDEQRQ